MKTWISILIVFTFIACTQAGRKKEITQTTDTIMKIDIMDKNSLEYITSILPVYQRIYDPETGLEMFDEKLTEGSEWNKIVKTTDGWIIDIFPSHGRGGDIENSLRYPDFI